MSTPVDPIRWTPGPLAVTVALDLGRPRLAEIRMGEAVLLAPAAPLPLVELGVVGVGRAWSARRYLDSVAGARLSYRHHIIQRTPTTETLTITSHDDATDLTVTTTLSAMLTVPVLRVWSEILNEGEASQDLDWVTSAVLGGMHGAGAAATAELWWADNDWLAENRWRRTRTRDVLPDLNRAAHQHDPRGAFAKTALGAWSSDGTLPLGVLIDPGTRHAVGWQIEHNGAWHWQVGERTDELYVSILGPTRTEHDWAVRLQPGERFTTVPVTLALSLHGFDGVIGALTAARRAGRRPHPDHARLPVVFNDYMNTLMGDPTTAKLIPLIDAAADAGAEIFCIDAGWYDDDADGWWDSVGAWEPATNRFPGGLTEVLRHIRDKNMVPGLWLEPEVVGVRSPVADALPDEAFFLRNGRRIVEHGRYQLDLRHPGARKHLDEVVDRLIEGLGVGYFKLDYNINPGAGTDHDAFSAGSGLLDHNRAHLAWIDGVLDRHPNLTLENCASGGMRADYAMLSRLQLQSTSDQQDPLRYPPIAAAAAAAITPEQAASWVYPQPTYSDDLIAFTMSAALLGRMHLSGHLDRMTDRQKDLVTEAISAYRQHRPFIARALPFWPAGLPEWEDAWIAHGLRDNDTIMLTVWRRNSDDDTQNFTIDTLNKSRTVRFIYPKATDAECRVVDTAGTTRLEITLPRRWQALTVEITSEGGL